MYMYMHVHVTCIMHVHVTCIMHVLTGRGRGGVVVSLLASTRDGMGMGLHRLVRPRSGRARLGVEQGPAPPTIGLLPPLLRSRVLIHDL